MYKIKERTFRFVPVIVSITANQWLSLSPVRVLATLSSSSRRWIAGRAAGARCAGRRGPWWGSPYLGPAAVDGGHRTARCRPTSTDWLVDWLPGRLWWHWLRRDVGGPAPAERRRVQSPSFHRRFRLSAERVSSSCTSRVKLNYTPQQQKHRFSLKLRVGGATEIWRLLLPKLM